MTCAALGCAGFFYAFVIIPSGFSIPCVFRLITGLKCPGCGITGACLRVLRGDWKGAASLNLGLAYSISILIPFLIFLIIRYVQKGIWHRKGWEDAVCWGLLIWFVGWGILRNIWGL